MKSRGRVLFALFFVCATALPPLTVLSPEAEGTHPRSPSEFGFGDLFTGTNTTDPQEPEVEWRHPDGSSPQGLPWRTTSSGEKLKTVDGAFDPDGNMYLIEKTDLGPLSQVTKLDKQGAPINGSGRFADLANHPTAIAVDARGQNPTGTVYASVIGNGILKFTGDGQIAQTYPIEGMETDALALAPDGCTMYYSDSGKIARYFDSQRIHRLDVCTGQKLSDFAQLDGFQRYSITALSILPDGRVLAAHAQNGISLLNSSNPGDFSSSEGTQIRKYETGPGDIHHWVDLALNPDATFWAASFAHSSGSDPNYLYKFDLAGNVLSKYDDFGPSGAGALWVREQDWTPGNALSVLDASAVQEGDSGTARATFTVELEREAATAVSFRYKTEAGTAQPGGDYREVSTGSATIPAHQQSVPIHIDVVGDKIEEQLETFAVELFSPVGAVFERARAIGTIVDDDATLEVRNASEQEPAAGSVPMMFKVTLSSAAQGPVSVRYSTQDGSAEAGTDYTPIDRTLTIPAGDREAFLAVDVLADSSGEGTENFSLRLSNATGAALGRAVAVGQIHDRTLVAGPVIPNPDNAGVAGDEGSAEGRPGAGNSQHQQQAQQAGAGDSHGQQQQLQPSQGPANAQSAARSEVVPEPAVQVQSQVQTDLQAQTQMQIQQQAQSQAHFQVQSQTAGQAQPGKMIERQKEIKVQVEKVSPGGESSRTYLAAGRSGAVLPSVLAAFTVPVVGLLLSFGLCLPPRSRTRSVARYSPTIRQRTDRLRLSTQDPSRHRQSKRRQSRR